MCAADDDDDENDAVRRGSCGGCGAVWFMCLCVCVCVLSLYENAIV